MVMRHKIDRHGEYTRFIVQRINEINEWRSEAILHAITPEQRAKVDARVLELREKAER